MEEGLEKKTSNETFIEKQLGRVPQRNGESFPRSVGSTLVPIKIGSSPRFLLQASGVLARATQYRRIQQRRTGQSMVGLQPFSCSRDLFFPRYRHATGSSTPLILFGPCRSQRDTESFPLRRRIRETFVFTHHDSKQIERACYKYKINKIIFENINRR